MSLRRLLYSTTVALAAVALGLVAPTPTTASAADTPPGQTKDGHYLFAVIGDVP